jgi:hypothetical protein
VETNNVAIVLVEINRCPVGVAVRCPGGYRFFTSDPGFQPLEQLVFKHIRSLIASARKLEREVQSTVRRYVRSPG